MSWSDWGKAHSKENKKHTHFCRQFPKAYNWGIAPWAQGRYECENQKPWNNASKDKGEIFANKCQKSTSGGWPHEPQVDMRVRIQKPLNKASKDEEVNLANTTTTWSVNRDAVGFTRRRAHMRWSNFGKVLCHENKITDRHSLFQQVPKVHNWGISPAQARRGWESKCLVSKARQDTGENRASIRKTSQ
jgi:hypothetical protein